MIGAKELLVEYGVLESDIKYLSRENGMTVVSVTAPVGRISTRLSVRTFFEALPKNEFICVNRAVVLSKRHIISVKGGVYEMSDGVCFSGRVRTAGEHKLQGRIASEIPYGSHSEKIESVYERLRVYDNLPLPFCAVETVYDGSGRLVDFIFRYCNRAMLAFYKKNSADIIDRSYYDVFAGVDDKWTDPFLSTLDRGGHLEAHDINENGVHVRTLNYEIESGLVGVVVISDGTTAHEGK